MYILKCFEYCLKPELKAVVFCLEFCEGYNELANHSVTYAISIMDGDNLVVRSTWVLLISELFLALILLIYKNILLPTHVMFDFFAKLQ